MRDKPSSPTSQCTEGVFPLADQVFKGERGNALSKEANIAVLKSSAMEMMTEKDEESGCSRYRGLCESEEGEERGGGRLAVSIQCSRCNAWAKGGVVIEYLNLSRR